MLVVRAELRSAVGDDVFQEWPSLLQLVGFLVSRCENALEDEGGPMLRAELVPAQAQRSLQELHRLSRSPIPEVGRPQVNDCRQRLGVVHTKHAFAFFDRLLQQRTTFGGLPQPTISVTKVMQRGQRVTMVWPQLGPALCEQLLK